MQKQLVAERHETLASTDIVQNLGKIVDILVKEQSLSTNGEIGACMVFSSSYLSFPASMQ